MLASSSLVACHRGDEARADSALNRDLNLVTPNDSALMIVSPAERTRLEAERVRASASRTPSSTSGSRSPRSTGGEVARSTSTAPAPSRVVKHTKRDAAIGAAAGAVIGGVTHGTKGAVIGGAAGGILGAVIGNNVDKKKKP
jgi:uncharacterized protein YcfJ